MTDQLRTELDALADLLDQQSARLHKLQFRLTELRLLLMHGNEAFVASAADDLAQAANRAAEGSILRASSIGRVAKLLGLPSGSGLADIAAAAPQPYSMILDHHVQATRESTAMLRLEGADVAKTVTDTLESSRDLLDLDPDEGHGLLTGLI